MRRSDIRVKGDERILGDGDFAETVLKAAKEDLDRKYEIQAGCYSFEWLIGRVATLIGISPKDIFMGGKYPEIVKVRSIICYWAVRELRMTTVDLAIKLNISQPTASQSVLRGKKIVEEQGHKLFD
jgi:putative transposase